MHIKTLIHFKEDGTFDYYLIIFPWNILFNKSNCVKVRVGMWAYNVAMLQRSVVRSEMIQRLQTSVKRNAKKRKSHGKKQQRQSRKVRSFLVP